jgi:hypothetical protein
MREDVLRRNLIFLAVVFSAHALLGVYAVSDEGYFVYGATAPERFVAHALSGDESHVTLSGASKYLTEDLCLQACPACALKCYDPAILSLSCPGGCEIRTPKGVLVASEGGPFRAVLKEGVLFENVVFACHEGVCGFDMPFGENQTYSAFLPDSMRK